MGFQLRDVNGEIVSVQAGESCNLVGQLSFGADDVNLAALATLTLRLFNKPTPEDLTPSILNSQNATDVKNANGGIVSAAGLVTMKLEAADNAIVDTTNIAVGAVEKHVARFTWTWTDAESVSRTGAEELEFDVERMAAPS